LYANAYDHVSSQPTAPLENIDLVEFVGVMVTHPSSPAHVEFSIPGVGVKMLYTLNGAPMQPPPYTAGAKDCTATVAEDDESNIGKYWSMDLSRTLTEIVI